MENLTFGGIELGTELPKFVRQVDQRSINGNAVALLDYNPIHINPAWAREVNLLGQGTTIAHGMTTFSYMTSALTQWCYPSGGFITRLESKFVQPVRPGDTITCGGVVSELHPRQKGQGFVVVELSAENQRGETVGVCKAHVRLPE
ncbi:MAG: MaoC family dehydratase [Proteobacteria bacterium]|nr:MaoC family dehydratase [Pseudomonadota bacterium]